jgi:predicted metal-dependent hydrolase
VSKLIIGNIEIAIIKKNIKNMYIRVLPPDGAVQITAPYGSNEETIRMFAVSRISWIKKQKKNFENQARQTKRQYATGESYYVWGKRYRLDVQYSNIRNEVKILGGKLILQVRKESTPAQRENVLNEWYREQLKQEIPGVLEKCEHIVGISCTEWQVKNMRTKWGTCNIEKRRIWLNLQLAKKTPECLAYVITHELVHLLERKHNDQFKQYMDQFFPNWRAVKGTLNQQMLDYMEE